LTVAGSDSGGGAGVQADIKVVTALGGYAMSAVTALTAQDTRGVWGVHPVPPRFVAQQAQLCLVDIGADAVKTGMLCNAAIVRAVAEVFRRRGAPNLVVDPVMVSKSGHRLLDAAAERALVRHILPLARVVTPNLHEAARLVGREVVTPNDMRRAAEDILRMGPAAVIVKGGHLPGVARDLLYDGREFTWLPSPRVRTRNTHGTGCSFSAALALGLARGLDLPDAARLAKRFITQAIRASLPLGLGHGPTDPMAGARGLG
jgi:hydroxymethylpyrimidine/phosphomethylpyrimidine kinase